MTLIETADWQGWDHNPQQWGKRLKRVSQGALDSSTHCKLASNHQELFVMQILSLSPSYLPFFLLFIAYRPYLLIDLVDSAIIMWIGGDNLLLTGDPVHLSHNRRMVSDTGHAIPGADMTDLTIRMNLFCLFLKLLFVFLKIKLKLLCLLFFWIVVELQRVSSFIN